MLLIFSLKLIKMFLCVLLSLFTVAFGASLPLEKTDGNRIVGGHAIDISEAPYQVSLLSWGRHTCGGSIIAEDLILTAAHCVIYSLPSIYQIRVGSSSSREGGQLYSVSSLVWHPGFTYSKMDYDVALLQLSRPLEFNSEISAVDLPEDGEEILDGEPTIVTGWGSTREGGSLPSQLQSVKVSKISSEECAEAYSPLYKITPRMLCAGVEKGGKDACQGDSGGPLVHNGKVVGVVSWGIGCARPDYPGVYAKVSSMRSWIDENALKLRARNVFMPFNFDY